MTIKRLYLKFLLSFLGILIITILLTSSLFTAIAGRCYKPDLDHQTIAKRNIFNKNNLLNFFHVLLRAEPGC